jgi:hypothetical protein
MIGQLFFSWSDCICLARRPAWPAGYLLFVKKGHKAVAIVAMAPCLTTQIFTMLPHTAIFTKSFAIHLPMETQYF